MNFEIEKMPSPESGVGSAIKRLKRESSFERWHERGGECFLENRADKKRFRIESIKSPEQPEVKKVQKILEKTFSRAEVAPIELWKSATEEGDYKVYVLKNERGKILSLLMGSLLDLLDKDGRNQNEVFFFGTYAVTDKKIRQNGLARELYLSALIDAKREAEGSGKKLKAFVGECTRKSESFWNKVGLKRAYVKKADGLLEEVKYVQPPTEWDPTTGLPPKGAGDAPEHLMAALFDSEMKEVSGREIMRIVNSLYDLDYRWKNSEFESEAAFKTHNQHINNLERQLMGQLNQGGESLILFAKEERLAAQKAGVKIIEHTAADGVVNAAGKEDL